MTSKCFVRNTQVSEDCNWFHHSSYREFVESADDVICVLVINYNLFGIITIHL